MILDFRGAEIELKIKTLYIQPEKETRNADVENLIFGADTESVFIRDEKGERYEPMSLQLAGVNHAPALQYVESRGDALQQFLEMFDDYAGLNLISSPEKHKQCFCYFHNLQYDWGQLIKNHPALIFMMLTGTTPNEDYVIFEKPFKAILKSGALFKGNAPFFTIEIWFNKEVNYKIKFRDTWSFFPAPLDKLGAELNLELYKKEHPESLGKIDYRTIPDGDAGKVIFEQYALADPEVTRLVAENIRRLHIQNQMYKIRVSAPSFAMGILYNSPEEHQLKSGCHNESIMQLILNSYAGGRTGGVYHGKISNAAVLDLHSSYPASMCSLPSFSTEMVYYEVPQEDLAAWTKDDLLEILNTYHCFLEIDGEERDSKYPSLLYASDQLYPVFGKFYNLATSGVETYVGIMSGSLDVTKIHRAVLLIDKDGVYKPFEHFARTAYHRKQNSEKGTPEYTSSKLVLNSSYGKLIEKLRDICIDDNNDLLLPVIEGMEIDCAQMYYALYCEMLGKGETQFIKYAEETISDLMNDTDLEGKIIYRFLSDLSLTKLSFGKFAIPAAAALITATSRARLLAGMKLLKPIYWDTDSLFFVGDIDIKKVNKLLAKSAKLLPSFIQPIAIGEELGDLDIEIEHESGYLAGTKRYYIENDVHKNCKNRKKCNDCPKKKQCEVKAARHGMPSTSKSDCEDLIECLATGSNADYNGRPKPLQIKEAKTADRIGLFESRHYTSKFKLDERLTWKQDKNGWNGVVKPFNEIVSRETC